MTQTKLTFAAAMALVAVAGASKAALPTAPGLQDPGGPTILARRGG